MNRSIRWQGLELATIEHCHVIANGRDTRIRGAVVGPDFGLFYRLKLDENGHTRTVRIERTDGKVLELFSDGAGGWSDDRAEPIAALRGCVDVDIWPTPMTNSLPIWRAEWTDQPIRFAMAWIDATDLSLRRSEQVYTRLDENQYRFQSADFERVISVDAEGLVTDYPGLFARIA
ncbi:putative glycolipid-binding domain-containing protein [Devosia chinhatensis]|uniref:putative glycolipid-binding domain-containing protein n=1 Tax=Devosia chinhatensis TaxID=429727 RepID=UPI0006982A39|nr:putative glycolipid-binding domain-containing protein [Devosia chinhatensis]